MLPPVTLNRSELLALIVGIVLGCVVVVALVFTLMVVHPVKSTQKPAKAKVGTAFTSSELT